MDSLTQIVLGAAVGELVLGRKVGNKAILWGAIAGTIPDLDVLTRPFVDGLRANELHRGVTHSILFSAVMAPLLGWWLKRHRSSLLALFAALVAAVFLLSGLPTAAKLIAGAVAAAIIALILWRSRGTDEATSREWSWLFWWCLVTHPLLDCHTNWGTQLLWPLPVKVAFNNIFVVDPFYTVPFLICVAATMFYQRTSRRRRWINGFGLMLSSSYMALTLIVKLIVHTGVSRSLDQQAVPYTAISTLPTPFNAVLWTATVETSDAFLIGYRSLLDENTDFDFIRVPKNRQLLGPWAEHRNVQRLAHLTHGRYVVRSENGTLVLSDIRFGQTGSPSPETPFVMRYRLIPDGDDLRVEAVPPPVLDKAEFNAAIAGLWTRLKGV
ncbi:MAG: metal-dependent hydrolase [Flavobacteriales bacterium]|nr:metal-dependent hydrolase [Flavobacteriales bacterium]